MIELTCQECGRSFDVRFPSEAKRAKFCSRECFFKSLSSNNAMIELTCQQCGKTFKAWMSRKRKNCSKACQFKAQIKRLECRCGNCGSSVSIAPCNLYNKTGLLKKHVFCDKKCEAQFRSDEMYSVVCANCEEAVPLTAGRLKEDLKKNKHFFCDHKCFFEFYNDTHSKTLRSAGREFRIKKGNVPWNKNLTSELDSRVRKAAEQKKGSVRPDMSNKMKVLSRKYWNDPKMIFKYFKGMLFGKDAELSELDEKIVKTRVLLFNLKRKENQNVSREKPV